jgi:hypothetical protein
MNIHVFLKSANFKTNEGRRAEMIVPVNPFLGISTGRAASIVFRALLVSSQLLMDGKHSCVTLHHYYRERGSGLTEAKISGRF